MSLCIFLNTNNADNTNIIFAHGSHSHGCLFAAVRSQFFEHEIRRRHTDRMEVITRMTRIFFCTRRRGAQCWVLNVECWIVAAGRNVELTNDEFRCSHEMFWTRITRMIRIIICTRILLCILNAHRSHGCMVNHQYSVPTIYQRVSHTSIFE